MRAPSGRYGGDWNRAAMRNRRAQGRRKEILTARRNTFPNRLAEERFRDGGTRLVGLFTAAKTALDIIRGIRSELPKGAEADEAQQKIEEAESALKRSKAELAKSLGFRLCKCQFPPEIMLWDRTERASIFPTCGDRNPPSQPLPNDYED